jgi:membrane protein YdbS with pleckstrin-like domain
MSIEEHLYPGEQVVYQAYVSRISLIPWGILGVALAAAGAFGWQQVTDPALGALMLLPAVAIVLVILGKLVILRSHEYVLTDRRLIQQTGLLSKRSVDARLDKINNVEHRQTLWGRLLGYGDVWIDTASETGTTVFNQIADPLEFKRAILATAESYRVAGRPPGGMPAAVPAAAPARLTGAERMRQLKQLLDDGLISEQEFEAKRQQLLSEL